MMQPRKKNNISRQPNLHYIERDEFVNVYLNDIRGYQPLSDKDTHDLLLIAQKGKTNSERRKAMDKLVKHNQRFIIRIVRQWAKPGHFLDLVNEANFGLIRAIQKFKPHIKTKFLSYALYWITYYIKDYIATKQNCVSPANAHKIYHYSNFIRVQFWKDNGREPTRDEIRDILVNRYKLSVPDARDLDIFKRYAYNGIADDSSDKQATAIDNRFVKELSSNNVDEMVEKEHLTKTLSDILQCLTEREKRILEMYHGVDVDEPLNFSEIGVKFGLSTERIRQLYHGAIKKCRNNKNIKYK